MEFYEAVKARRSIRGYKPDPIPESVVARLADAVASAPSACNLQPVKLLFITNPGLKARIADIYTQPWLKQAPAIAVILVDAKSAWHRLEGDSIADIDGAIAMENFVLAAAAEGLGTCWICAFDRGRMDAAVNVEAPWHSFAITPVGYPAVEPKTITRKSHNSIFQELT